jgi:hypothetical protein
VYIEIRHENSVAWARASRAAPRRCAHEIGEINGARFRIDVPEKWNGGLVVYCHGYSDSPGNYENKPNPAAGANQ